MDPFVIPRRRSAHASFWAVPVIGVEKNWRTQWDHLVDQVRRSDHLTLYNAIEEGVPTNVVVLISKALCESAPGVLDIIGLPETTYQRKAKAGETLPDAAGHRTVAIMRVVATLRQMLAESGDADQVKEFDLEGWVSTWIRTPLPELGGATPAALLRNPDGQRVIESLLERMRGGLAA